MKFKFLSLFLAIGLMFGAQVKAQETAGEQGRKVEEPELTITITNKACDVIVDHEITECIKLCGSNKDAQKIGECIKSLDPDKKSVIRSGLRDDCGAAGLKAICSSVLCRKILGKGGDKNCKAICCAAGNGDVLKACCKAAGDKKCCGAE